MFSFQSVTRRVVVGNFPIFFILCVCATIYPTKDVSLRCKPFARKMVKRKMVKKMKPLERVFTNYFPFASKNSSNECDM